MESSAYDARTIDFARCNSLPAAAAQPARWRLSKLLLIITDQDPSRKSEVYRRCYSEKRLRYTLQHFSSIWAQKPGYQGARTAEGLSICS